MKKLPYLTIQFIVKCFDKQINLLFVPLFCLVLATTCPNNNQVPITLIKDHKNHLPTNKIAYNRPPISFSGYRILGSLSSMEGSKTDFLLQIKCNVADIDEQFQIALIAIADRADAASSLDPLIITSALDCRNTIQKVQYQANGQIIIYWVEPSQVRTGKTKWMIKIDKATYQKLTSSNYAIYMLYAPKNASVQSCAVFATPSQMDIAGKEPSTPDWRGIGLEAVSYGQKQVADGTAFVLKGNINEAFLKEENNVGFILLKEGVNILDLVQQIIASENGWPTVTTSFSSEMVIVPAKFRNLDPYIIADLLPKELPVQSGKYKILCYIIKNEHYYLSQMEQFLPDFTTRPLAQGATPPSITFDGSSHGLKVLDLKLIRTSVPGQHQTVKILEDCSIQYYLNNEIKDLPSNLQSSLLFIQKGTTWRTTAVEALFKNLQPSNSHVSITDDKTMALISDFSKPLDQSGIDFFNRAADYEYFACLFSKEDNKLIFYTQKEKLSIEEKKLQKLDKPKITLNDEVNITLNNEGAKIILHHISFWKEWKPFGKQDLLATLIPPKVNLEPSGFDKNKIIDGGFLIGKSINIAHLLPTIESFIKSKDQVWEYKQFLLLKEKILEKELEEHRLNLERKLYHMYKGTIEQQLEIIYWAQYKGKIVWSNPVRIELILKKK